VIRIIQGVYGHYTGKRVVPKDKHSAPFRLSPEQEQRLVEQGVAIYVDEQPVADAAVDEMDAKELRAYGKSLGLSFKVGAKNTEMRESIIRHLSQSEEPAKAYEAVPADGVDTEPAPTFDPTEAVQ
jgi:hypothetical protein